MYNGAETNFWFFFFLNHYIIKTIRLTKYCAICIHFPTLSFNILYSLLLWNANIVFEFDSYDAKMLFLLGTHQTPTTVSGRLRRVVAWTRENVMINNSFYSVKSYHPNAVNLNGWKVFGTQFFFFYIAR